MYLASLFNERGLFQHLNGWVLRAKDDVKLRLDAKVQDVYYRATSVIVAMDRMAQLDQDCVREYAEFESETDVKDARIVFWSPRLVGMLNEVPGVLIALRILQNSLLPMFAAGRVPPVSVPQSMHDAVKRSHKIALPDELKNRVLDYWHGGGNRLKQYRDIDQHYVALARNCFLTVKEPRRVTILMPDNPESRRSEDFTFLEELDFVDFVREAFGRLHALYEQLAAMEGGIPTRLGQGVGMSPLGNLEEGINKTLAVVVDGAPTDPALIIGQTEDRRLTVRQAFRTGERLPPGVDDR